MPSFTDANGAEWQIRFDGLLLADVRDRCNVDLADIQGGGIATVEDDPVKMTQVLLVLCADQLDKANVTKQRFAEAIRGEVFERAATAIWGAATNFFPPSRLSAMQSNLSNLRRTKAQMAALQPQLELLNCVPPLMRETVLMAVNDELKKQVGGLLQSGEAGNPTNVVSG